jgi:selenocysteine lyase/cysteine desulfurase
VVTLAAVALWTGQRRDLAAVGQLARAAGALFVVDAAQALGALSMDLSGVDAVCGSGRKWLLGPPEVGVLALRPGVEDRLVCSAPGSLSLDSSGSWREGARRFEGGVVGAPVLAGLGASCGLLDALDREWVEGRVLERAEEVAQRAEAGGWRVVSPGGAERSGIVVLERHGLREDLEARLRERRVVARVRGDQVRVSAHFWNESDDVERLFEGLGSLC